MSLTREHLERAKVQPSLRPPIPNGVAEKGLPEGFGLVDWVCFGQTQPHIQLGSNYVFPHRALDPPEFGCGKEPVDVGGAKAFAVDREPDLVGFVPHQLLPRFSARGKAFD
ncbi:unnamed protein product [Sphagnum tenellum]